MVEPSASAAELAQQLLDDAQKSADASRLLYTTHAKRRLMLAYLLKAVALFGGLFVATVKIDPTIPGVIIAAAVILDQLMSNHRRMLTETIAASAITRTQRRVGNSFNDQVVSVVEANEKGQGEAAAAMLTDLARNSAKVLRDELDRIHTAVEDSNIEFLGSLNVDRPTETPLPKA